LRDSRAKKWNIAGYEGAPALDGSAREGAKGRQERVRQGERSVLTERGGAGGGGGEAEGGEGASSRRKKPMRFRGRLIGSRTYTYSPSTNPTVRVLIFTPCPSSRPIHFACSHLPFTSGQSRSAQRPSAVSRANITKSGTSLTHWKRTYSSMLHVKRQDRKCSRYSYAADSRRYRRVTRTLVGITSRSFLCFMPFPFPSIEIHASN